jgi:hypothetical protein
MLIELIVKKRAMLIYLEEFRLSNSIDEQRAFVVCYGNAQVMLNSCSRQVPMIVDKQRCHWLSMSNGDERYCSLLLVNVSSNDNENKRCIKEFLLSFSLLNSKTKRNNR